MHRHGVFAVVGSVLLFGAAPSVVATAQASALPVVASRALPSRLVIGAAVSAGRPVRFTEADNGRLVHLLTGQKLTVLLRTCTDCGYSWKVAIAPDRSVVRVIRTTLLPLPHPRGIVGYPWESTWVLQATGPGLSVLKLYELPPGRPAPPVAQYLLRFAVAA
ncbi:MAG: protease inhibitor I42 family protein [Acidimicrobiales bacterium]